MSIALVIRYTELGEPEGMLLHLGDGLAESRAAFVQREAANEMAIEPEGPRWPVSRSRAPRCAGGPPE